MAMAKYEITESDYSYSVKYLREKLRENESKESIFPYDNYDRNYTARLRFKEITKTRETQALNTWCEEYLDSKQWTQLKNAIRANRRRKKDEKQENPTIKHISLSYDAWKILSDLAKSDDVTYSECIVNRLNVDYLKLTKEDDAYTS